MASAHADRHDLVQINANDSRTADTSRASTLTTTSMSPVSCNMTIQPTASVAEESLVDQLEVPPIPTSAHHGDVQQAAAMDTSPDRRDNGRIGPSDTGGHRARCSDPRLLSGP